MSSAAETSGLCANVIIPAVTEVSPVGILTGNQLEFLFSSPMFNLLFACNCRMYISEGFDIDEHVDFIAMSKAFDKSRFVLIHSSFNVVCDTDIECARLVGHDIDIIGSTAWHDGIILNGRDSVILSLFVRIFQKLINVRCSGAGFLHFVRLRRTSVEMTPSRLSCRSPKPLGGLCREENEPEDDQFARVMSSEAQRSRDIWRRT